MNVSRFEHWNYDKSSFIHKDILILNSKNEKMGCNFEIIKDPNFLIKSKRHEKQIKSSLLWTIWIISLLKFVCISNKKLPKISDNSKKMLEIIKKNKHFEYMKTQIQINKNKNFNTTNIWPYINPEIFLSKTQDYKLDIKMFVFILQNLYEFKFLYLKKGSWIIYYDHYKLFFERLSRIPKFPLILYNNGFPTRGEVGNLKKLNHLNWIEKNIDYSFIENDLYDSMRKCEIQKHNGNVQGTGMKSQTNSETTFFLKFLIFIFHNIPWNKTEIYENPHNCVLLYYFTIVYFAFLCSIILGSRNLFQIPLQILTSELKVYIEKEPIKNVNEIKKIIKNKEKVSKIEIFEFIKNVIFEEDEDIKFINDFILENSRSNRNKPLGTKGFLRTNCFLCTTLKKIGKGRDESTITQPRYLSCAHTLGNFKENIQSSFLTYNQNPFPCLFCVGLLIFVFLYYLIRQSPFHGNMTAFHQFLFDHKCIQNNKISYFVKIDENGIVGEKIEINHKNNKMRLPCFDEKTNKFVFLSNDPGNWILKVMTQEFLILNNEKIYFEDFFLKKCYELPKLTLDWFSVKDIFYWFNDIKTKIEKKEKCDWGVYNFRAISTYFCNVLDIPKFITRMVFGWNSKEGTQEKFYNHSFDLRNETLYQIYYQYSFYVYLIFGDKINYFMNFKDIQNDVEMKKILNRLHPLIKPL